MAVMMRMHWAGLNQSQYDAVKTHVDWVGRPPEGGIFHIASVEKDGLHVTDVWQTAESFQRFVDTRLMPAVKQLNIPGQPEVVVHPAHAVFDPVHRVEL
jgi:hypothetical protein